MVSAWIQHVKKFAAEHKMKFGDALPIKDVMLPTNLTHPLQRKRLPQLRNKNHQNVDLTPDLNLIEEKTNKI